MGPKILYFFLLFLPLAFSSLLFNSSEIAKVNYLRLTVEILIGLYWVSIISQLSYFVKHPRRYILTVAVFCWFFWVLITSLVGESWPNSLFGNYFRQQGIITLYHFILLFILVKLLEIKIKQNLLAISLILGASLASMYAIFQPYPTAGTFGNPNFLGGYLAIILPFGFYLAQKHRAYFALLPFLFLAIILSGSRIAILLSILTIFFYLFLSLKKKWVLPLSVIILILAFIPFAKETSPFENRIKIWEKGFVAASRRPIFGWGLENFESGFRSVLVPARDITLMDLRVDKAHNEFLEILVASGVIGLGLYALIIGWSLRSICKKMEDPKESSWWKAVALSLIIFVLRSQVNPVSVSEQALFWLFIGLAGSERQLVVVEELPPTIKKIGSGVVFLTLAFMAIFNFRGLLGDYCFKKGILVEGTNKAEAGLNFKKAAYVFPWEGVYRAKADEMEK